MGLDWSTRVGGVRRPAVAAGLSLLLIGGLTVLLVKLTTPPAPRYVPATYPLDPNWVDDEFPIGDAGCGN